MTNRPGVTVVAVDDSERLATAYRIRVEVFVDEQHVPLDEEIDDLDPGAEHLLLLEGNEPVATGRLVVEPAGYEGADPELGHVAHLGRIAVLAPYRGLGYGAQVVRALEARALARGLKVAYLSGQLAAVPFYVRLGYAPHGPVFLDAKIEHRHMTRTLIRSA